ncbi:hypothetical protein JCM6882_009737 [Rhodosporidiobolus microsporus]
MDPSALERWIEEYRQSSWATATANAPRDDAPAAAANSLSGGGHPPQPRRPSLRRDTGSGSANGSVSGSGHNFSNGGNSSRTGSGSGGSGFAFSRRESLASTAASSVHPSPPPSFEASKAPALVARGAFTASPSPIASPAAPPPSAPHPTSSSPSNLNSGNPLTAAPSFPPLSLSPSSLVAFYTQNGYMPAPLGAFEAERLRVMKRYGLDRPERREGIERVVRLAKGHFGTQTVIVTLVLDGQQVLVGESGWIPSEPDPSMETPCRALPYETSFCAHAIKRQDHNEPFIVADASRDWRFAQNPLSSSAGGPLSFYASASILLPSSVPHPSSHLNPAGHVVPENLPVGAICLIDGAPREEGRALSEADKRFLNDLAGLVGREFQHGYEHRRREIETQRTAFIGSFLDSTLVYTQPGASVRGGKDPLSAASLRQNSSTSVSAAASTGASPVNGTPLAPPSPATPASASSSASASAADAVPSPLRSLSLAVDKLVSLTGCTSAAIFDLRSFRAPQRAESALKGSSLGSGQTLPSQSAPSTTGTGAGGDDEGAEGEDGASPLSPGAGFVRSRQDKFPTGLGRVYLLGSAGPSPSDGGVDWAAQAASPLLPHAVCDALRRFYDTNQSEFDESTPHSAFEQLLPANATATSLVPIFDVDGTPALLLALTSTEPYFQFDPSDQQFVRNVGAVAMSGLLRQRALEAERAKLSFISTISHELRTPLHGINSQIELLREFSSPEQLLKIAPLLDVADVCLESLRDVLDDTLDFSKLSNNSPEEIEAAQQRSLARNDLEQICDDVAKAVWVRKRRVDLVNADATAAGGGPGGAGKKGKVDVVLEVEERKGGWGVWVDSGGMKRVLLNVLGNALKFTDQGSVKLTLCEVPNPSSGLPPNHHIVQLTVTDTGRGMSEEFLRDGSLFIPFKREDSFADGAGLGLSIVEQIIRRMGGKVDVTSALGKGTTIRITVPLEFCPPAPDPKTPLPTPSLPPSIAHTPRPRAASLSISQLTFRRRIISDELASLFDPGTKLASPFLETAGYDFAQAVEAAQASLGKPKLGRVPTLRRKRSGLGSKATEGDLVDEMAKLSVGAASSPQAASLHAPGGSYFAIPRTAVEQANVETPVAQVGVAAPLPSPSSFIPATPKSRFASRARVLIADDNPIGRSILAKLFQGKGISFSQAENGVEAVSLYTSAAASPSTRFHLLLTDIHMPLLSGFGAASRIRELERSAGLPYRCRIVALTGLSSEQDFRAAEEAGVDEFLVKGGKSLAVVLREVKAIEEELKAQEEAAMLAGEGQA